MQLAYEHKDLRYATRVAKAGTKDKKAAQSKVYGEYYTCDVSSLKPYKTFVHLPHPAYVLM